MWNGCAIMLLDTSQISESPRRTRWSTRFMSKERPLIVNPPPIPPMPPPMPPRIPPPMPPPIIPPMPISSEMRRRTAPCGATGAAWAISLVGTECGFEAGPDGANDSNACPRESGRSRLGMRPPIIIGMLSSGPFSSIAGLPLEKSTSTSARSPGASVRERTSTGAGKSPPSEAIQWNGLSSSKNRLKMRAFEPFTSRSRTSPDGTRASASTVPLTSKVCPRAPCMVVIMPLGSTIRPAENCLSCSTRGKSSMP